MTTRGDILPRDEHNTALLANVHPAKWVNPEPAPAYNLAVLGGGPAGLSAAATASALGAKVALVERELLGGECLNVGCIPSKLLIRSARAAYDAENAERFGVKTGNHVAINFDAVMERMRKIRAAQSAGDAAAHFRDAHKVDVFFGEGAFSGPDAVVVDGRRIKFKKAIIATGTRPNVPPIPGLAQAGFLTNETLFSLQKLPERLAIIGGGAIGCEMAQAFARLGSRVKILESNARILSREDSEAAQLVDDLFRREEIEILTRVLVKDVTLYNTRRLLYLTWDGREEELEVDEILVGTGRVPNLEAMGLENAEVDYSSAGIKVDEFLQTTNPDVYAAGDVALDYKFTHMAHLSARVAVENALLLGRRKMTDFAMPWVTFTDPEIAQLGITEREASESGMPVEVYKKEFRDLDRPVIDGDDQGFVKVLVKKGTDKIAGATIVGRNAGEMINELTLAMQAGLGLKQIAHVVHPFPTYAETIKAVADLYNHSTLRPAVKTLVSKWMEWIR